MKEVEELNPFAGMLEPVHPLVSADANPFAGCEAEEPQCEDCALGSLEEEGLGMPPPADPHQITISDIERGVYNFIERNKLESKYFVYREIEIRVSFKNYIVPDIIVTSPIRVKNRILYFSIEVCLSNMVDDDLDKTSKLILDKNMKEGFVFDYMKMRWHGLNNMNGQIQNKALTKEGSSYSTEFGIDLNRIIDFKCLKEYLLTYGYNQTVIDFDKNKKQALLKK